MKQTAVEWLSSQLGEHIIWEEKIIDLIEQAKEMEKEQMKALYSMHMVDKRTMELYEFDEYYNETFKTE